MSLSAAVIDALLATGATREQLAAAVKADIAEREAAEAERVEAKRAGNRQRQKRFKERQAANNVDNALPALEPVTGVTSPPLDENISNPPRVASRRVISSRARETFPAPGGVTDAQWKGFLQLRIAKRQPMTQRGYALLVAKLEKLAEHGFPPGEMIDLAIERGWTTVHEPHDTGQPRNGNHSKSVAQPSHNLRGARPDPSIDMLRDANAELAEAAAGRYPSLGGEAWPPLPALGSG